MLLLFVLGLADLYAVLGVTPGASSREVKRAYKRLREKNQAQAQAAYEVLADPSSRELYDKYGDAILNATAPSVFGYNLRSDFGGILMCPLQMTLSELAVGGRREVKVVQTVECVCPRGGVKCAKCRQSPFMEKIVRHVIEVPPGAPDGFRVFVRELGDEARAGGAEDVVFVVRCRKDTRFEREGADVLVTANVTIGQALSAGFVEVEGVDGEVVRIEVGTGISDGEVRRIKEKGLPVFGESKKRGDLVVTLRLQLPGKLTEEQRKIVEEILQ